MIDKVIIDTNFRGLTGIGIDLYIKAICDIKFRTFGCLQTARAAGMLLLF